MKTIEQRRAADALSRVDALSTRVDKFKARYRAYVDRLGPSIVMNGLGQALATERAAAGPNQKNDEQRAHHELYVSLQSWLCRPDDGVYPPDDGVYPPDHDLLQAIMKDSESRYLHAQAEALAWLEWHKKCCRASFPKGQEDET